MIHIYVCVTSDCEEMKREHHLSLSSHLPIYRYVYENSFLSERIFLARNNNPRTISNRVNIFLRNLVCFLVIFEKGFRYYLCKLRDKSMKEKIFCRNFLNENKTNISAQEMILKWNLY